MLGSTSGYTSGYNSGSTFTLKTLHVTKFNFQLR